MAFNSMNSISSHYKMHCSNKEAAVCLVRHCTASFLVYSSYTAHMSRYHRNITVAHFKENCKRQVPSVNCEIDNEPLSDTITYNSVACPDDVVTDDGESAIRNMALLFLKMKAQYGLPDSARQSLVTDFSQIMDVSSYHTRCSISKLFKQHGVSCDVSVDILKIIEDNNWQNAVKHLSTNCNRNAYYRDNFPYVPPEAYKFSADCLLTDCFQYVSIIATLRQLLQNVQVRSQILHPLPEVEGRLITFRDGIRRKEYEVFSKCETSLEVVLYSDEFEMMNPLGPHK
jgi:hypothetical protein